MIHLTWKEKEVVKLLRTGLSNTQIACRLDVKSKTVSNHVNRISHKYGVSSRSKLIVAIHNEEVRKNEPLKNTVLVKTENPLPKGSEQKPL